MEEVWKDIEGYAGLYQVSNMGRVKSLRKKKEYIKKPSKQPNGYQHISFTVNRQYTFLYIHRLVAEAFLPNPNQKNEVNHLDGNKSNNTVNNLQWTTAAENTNHAIRTGLTNQNKQGNYNWKGYINIYTKNDIFCYQAPSLRYAADWIIKNTKYKQARRYAIGDVCNGKRFTAYGFKFKRTHEKI
jgi:hypothetical protein